MENQLFIASSYLLLGGGIKYIDQAYDLGVFNKIKANIVGVLCGILMAYLIVTDPPSTAIFLAMVLSLAITRKIDNLAFYIGTGLVLVLPIVFDGIIELQWLPFGFLAIAGVSDEIGNDWADKRIKKRLVNIASKSDNKFVYQFAEKFFMHRFSMKLAVSLLVLASFFNWIYFFAFLLFDLMYLSVDMYSMTIKVYSINRMHISQ